MFPRLQFDPGILPCILRAYVPESAQQSSVIHSGQLSFSNSFLYMPRVLFDTGALQSNYIDSDFVSLNPIQFLPITTFVDHSVRLGDNITTIHLDRTVRVTASFTDSKNNIHTAEIECSVLKMPGTHMIIGLPSILFTFFDFFVDMLHHARASLKIKHRIPSDILQFFSPPSDCIHPWNTQPFPEAKEETDTPEPCSFRGPLHFLNNTHAESVKEYHDLFATHLSPDFVAAVPELIAYMKSNIVESVFVPKQWTGITGVEPLKLVFADTLPKILRPKARSVNPSMLTNAKKEFDRLCQYFYEPSTSPIASCLVIAPKATPPYIRLCGDYVQINKHISIPHYPIPNVQQTLYKALGFMYFIDLDWANAFHQMTLDKSTARNLSIQTIWGLVQPKFVPEGIGPASGVLQHLVMNLFSDFDDWTIAIFDNLLVLAHSYDDAFSKLKLIINRCNERNVVLKFSKSWFAFPSVNFFGYLIKKNTYEMSADRKEGIMAIEMPYNTKSMQRFLGSALFFKGFLPNYSELTANLNDMTKDTFDWNSTNWKIDYLNEFNVFKSKLFASVAVYFPDYSLPWILRTDASDVACAAVLIQTTLTGIEQPIAFLSQKFSLAAKNWDIHKKEAYSIFFGVSKLEYLLRSRTFVIETDHANLLYMEKNCAPIITRWRVYLQSYNIFLRHIPGKSNVVADWLSRQYSLSPLSTITPSSESHSPNYYFEKVHGGRRGHPGAKRTWTTLNLEYPSHKIPFATICDMIASCPTCQKIRIGMISDIKPLILHNKPPHSRSRIGVDTLTVTPIDSYGNYLLIVVVEHFTKYVSLYPVKDHSAQTMATSLFQHFCRFGIHDQLISDPGSDLMSEIVILLNKWFGIDKFVSLFDRHESNGVELTNKQILRHLSALVHDERISQSWSDPTVLPLIEHFLNSAIHSETSLSPLEAKFGSSNLPYFS